MVWLYYTCLVLLQLTGLLLTLLSLPGLWLMVGALAAYAWWTGFDKHTGWASLGTVLGLALVAEVVEFLAGAAGSAKAGGTKRAMAGSIVGGLVGAIVLTPLIPIPVVGTIAGLCLGTFGGAFLTELYIRRDPQHSAGVGLGAAKGRLWGVAIKLLFGAVIFLVIAVTALPL